MADIVLKVFNPSDFTAEKRTRLNTLLDALDIVVDERKQHLTRGRVKALKQWLNDPSVDQAKHDYLPMFEAIPEGRWPEMVKALAKDFSCFPSTAKIVTELEASDSARQKKAIAFMSSQYANFVDKLKDRQYWNLIDSLYESILSEFPDILSTTDDIKDSFRLGEVLGREKESLVEIWKTANGVQKIEKARSILCQAYPDDEVDNIHIAPVAIKKAAAGFHTCLPVDTMICGPLFADIKSMALPMFLFMHEFQHRRQLRLIDQLEKNQLSPDSVEYYQARLFRANFDGGYLTPMTAIGKLGMYAKYTDYFEQPVEAQANNQAKLASIIGGTGGDVIWDVSEKLSKAFSAAVRPVEKVAYGINRVLSSVTSIGRKKPDFSSDP